jgi:hypothetical protein
MLEARKILYHANHLRHKSLLTENRPPQATLPSAAVCAGATVDGPSATDNFQGLDLQDGMRPCPASGGDTFQAFSGKGARYLDNVIAWPSVEPPDDYTVLGILAFAGQVAS